MGKKGKKAQAGKPKKLTPKDVSKRLDTLAKKLVEELQGADLFAPLPPMDDCAVCLTRLSRSMDRSAYQACCGKHLCGACYKGNHEFIAKENEKNAEKEGYEPITYSCPFCREPEPSSEVGYVDQVEARIALGDHAACLAMSDAFDTGQYGLPKNELKALDYCIQAAELGSSVACACIATNLREGIGVSIDLKRSVSFDIISAIRGNINARHNFGCFEYAADNYEAATRHWKIAAEAGFQPSIGNLREIYNANGLKPGKEFISKDDMDKIYRAGHDAQEEVKSEEREKHLKEDKWEC